MWHTFTMFPNVVPTRSSGWRQQHNYPNFVKFLPDFSIQLLVAITDEKQTAMLLSLYQSRFCTTKSVYHCPSKATNQLIDTRANFLLPIISKRIRAEDRSIRAEWRDCVTSCESFCCTVSWKELWALSLLVKLNDQGCKKVLQALRTSGPRELGWKASCFQYPFELLLCWTCTAKISI